MARSFRSRRRPQVFIQRTKGPMSSLAARATISCTLPAESNRTSSTKSSDNVGNRSTQSAGDDGVTAASARAIVRRAAISIQTLRLIPVVLGGVGIVQQAMVQGGVTAMGAPGTATESEYRSAAETPTRVKTLRNHRLYPHESCGNVDTRMKGEAMYALTEWSCQ